MGPLEGSWRVWCGKQYVCLPVLARVVVLLLLAELGRSRRAVYELQFSHFWWVGTWFVEGKHTVDRWSKWGCRIAIGSIRTSRVTVCCSPTVFGVIQVATQADGIDGLSRMYLCDISKCNRNLTRPMCNHGVVPLDTTRKVMCLSCRLGCSGNRVCRIREAFDMK